MGLFSTEQFFLIPAVCMYDFCNRQKNIFKLYFLAELISISIPSPPAAKTFFFCFAKFGTSGMF